MARSGRDGIAARHLSLLTLPDTGLKAIHDRITYCGSRGGTDEDGCVYPAGECTCGVDALARELQAIEDEMAATMQRLPQLPAGMASNIQGWRRRLVALRTGTAPQELMRWGAVSESDGGAVAALETALETARRERDQLRTEINVLTQAMIDIVAIAARRKS